MTNTRFDCFRGALLGLAVADAVGTTLEFKPPGSFAPIDDMVGGGPFRLQSGQWTDDTSMALCLAASLVERQGFDAADQMARYVRWWREGYMSSTDHCFDIGNTVARALSRFEADGNPFAGSTDPYSAGNGSIMRLAPVSLFYLNDPMQAIELAGESSRTTHGAPAAVDACRFLAALLVSAINGAGKAELLAANFWSGPPLQADIAAVAAGSYKHKNPPQIKGTGYVVASLEAALWAFYHTDDFRAACLLAANLGDDADTTAAIAGQLAGARWGASGIPTRWRATVTAGERITSLAQRLYQAGGGHLAEPPWPHDGLVHGWWVEPGRVLAGEYPGSPDPVKARHKLDVLIDAGMRTFVDLTTEADGLAPYAPLVEELAATRGLDLRRVRFPIPDLDVVADADYDVATRLVDEGRDRGGVYVHCWGGIGRTGTVIGCRLVDEGLTYDEVTARLDRLRAPTRKAARRAPETVGQHDLLRRRARA